MNTLSEDQYIRVQKQRKQQLYKNMLDQQVRLNEMKRQKDNYQKYQFDGRYAQPRNSTHAYPPQENKILPPISNHYRQPKQYQLQSNRHKYSKSITEQDERTQLYLNNCEEIIRNLRELKTKKKQKQSSPNPPVDMAFKKENERVPTYQMQYYPKPTYFSSSGSAYNKNVSTDPLPKKGKLQSTRLTTRLNTLEDVKLSNDKYTKRYSSKKISNDKKTSNPIEKEDDQSQSPRGIKDQKKSSSSKKPSKIRHKLFKLVPPKKGEEIYQQSSPQQSFKQEEQQDRQLELKLSRTDQKQLGQCLSELTRYLKNLNDDKQRQKNASPDRDDNDGLNIETPVTHKRTNSPIPKEKQPISQDPDEEDKQNQQQDDENRPLNESGEKFDTLKQKVMDALKQANQQSHTLFLKMSDRSTSRSPFNPKDAYSGSPTSPFKEGKSNTYLSDPSSGEKPATENDQLVKLMVSHLDKHNDSNEQLNKCLKELHSYLKNQNQQIKEIITSARENQSRKQPRNSQKNSNSKPKNTSNPLKTQQKDEEEQIKSGSLKLQDAILKSLKKARLRGNVLKEKIQVFRKEHPSKHQLPIINSQKEAEPSDDKADKIEEKQAEPPQQEVAQPKG